MSKNYNVLNNDYLAGFFDGEGCGRVAKVGGSKGRRRYWKPLISLSNTNKEVMDEIYDFIKLGHLHKYHIKKDGKIQWKIYITNPKSIIKFCDLIIDKVIIKREILELIKKFAIYLENTRKKHKVSKGKCIGWTDEDIQFINEKYVIPIRDLIRVSSGKGKRSLTI